MHAIKNPSLSEKDELLIRRISEEIYSRGKVWFGSHTHIKNSLPEISVFQNSFFLRYPLSGNRFRLGTVLVKIPRQPDMKFISQAVSPGEELIERTKREFDVLEEVFDVVMKLKILALTAIRPLFYYPQWNAIVMEELPSRTLEEIISDFSARVGIGSKQQIFLEALYRTGQWLRMYHEALGDMRLEPFNANEMREDVNNMLDTKANLVGNQFDLSSIKDNFEHVLDRLNGVTVPHVKLHGDLFFQNVIVTPDLRVALLDLNRQRWGPIYYDLATLITELLEQRLKLNNFGFLMRREKLKQWERVILDGYSNREAADEAVISLYCARSMLGMWGWYERRYGRSNGAKKKSLNLLNPAIRRYFHHELSIFMDRAIRESENISVRNKT